MTPVYQRVVDKDRGDCMRAAVASILEFAALECTLSPTCSILAPYVDRGLVSRVDLGDLSIFSYTAACAYAGKWDAVTMAARGLVLNRSTDEVVALAFPKFFNLGERGIDQSIPDAAPDVVTVKLDGSLGIGFRHEGAFRWTTRGSFYSPQAEIANRIWARDHARVRIPEDLTPLVEIIAPGTRNVVDYGEREALVLLGIRSRFTGADLPYSMVADWARAWGLDVTERVAGTLAEIVERAGRLDHQHEGFVARWGDFRLKVKSTEYMRVARLRAGLTERAIADLWYAQRADLLAPLPEEHRDHAAERWAVLDGETHTLFAELDELWGRVGRLPDKKTIALAMDRGSDLFGAIMARAGGKRADLRRIVYRRHFDANPRDVGDTAPAGVAT